MTRGKKGEVVYLSKKSKFDLLQSGNVIYITYINDYFITEGRLAESNWS